MKTITYDPMTEEDARSSWYLGERDKFVFRITKKFTNLNLNKKMLDAGCGTGGIISYFQNIGIHIIGNDTSLESLSLGKKRGKIIHCIQASNIHLPFRDEAFDITITSEVLEHVEDDLLALKELCRVTRHRIIFTVPGHMYLWTSSDDILLHKRRYSKLELETLVKESGMHIIKLKPYGMIPATMVMAYKFVSQLKSKKNKTTNDELPFTSRYTIPKTLDNLLRAFFFFDLWLSERGLIFWGHSWWGCIEKKR